MKKNIIIEGDVFQKEYKKQYRDEMVTNFIQGLILVTIALLGIIFGQKILLKLIIYIFPLFILTYAVNLFIMGLRSLKINMKTAISFFIQAVIPFGLALYIFFDPISSLGLVLVIIGILIILNGIIKMIYFPDYIPVSAFITGGMLILFSDFLINLFYTMVMVFLLFVGIGKIGKAIYSFKEK